MKKTLIIIILLICSVNVFAQLRSFNDIFPNLNDDIRTAVFSPSGYLQFGRRSSGFVILGRDNSRLDPQIVNIVLSGNPGYIVESISVIPKESKDVSILDIYNILGNIRDLKGRLYNSYTRNKAVPLFEEATRIVSERQMTAIPDPAPSSTLPASETVYIRLKDANFGNTYYRAEMALIQNGLRYTLTNFKSMNYLLIPVIKEGNFIAQLYFEPIREGVLIYSMAGTEISDFFASKIDIDSAISKRLDVIISWASDGIRNN